MSSFVAPEYVPSAAVMQIHSLPRLDAKTLALSDNVNFALTNMDEMTDIDSFTKGDGTATSKYLTGVATLPIVIIAVGIVSVLILQIFLFLRCCCTCMGCKPKEEELVNKPEVIIKRRNHAVFGFWFFTLAMTLTAHLLYFPSNDLDAGVNNVIGVLNELKDIFGGVADALRAGADNVQWEATNEIYDLGQKLINQDCDFIGYTPPPGQAAPGVQFSDGLKTVCETIDSTFTTFAELMEGVSGNIDGMKESVTLFGGEYKDLGLYGMYGFILAIVLIFALGNFFSSKFIMVIGMLIGEVVCIAFTLYCAVTMIIVILYSDFCADPAQSLSGLLKGIGNEFGADNVVYFSSCNGHDPFVPQFDDVYAGLEKLSGPNGLFETIKDVCTDAETTNGGGVAAAVIPLVTAASNMIGTAVSSSGVFSNVEDMQAQVTCSKVNPVYDGFVNKAFCTNTFNGLYKIWGVAFLANFFLFFVMCYSSVMWQYFGVAWKLKPTSKHHGEHHQLDGGELAPQPGAAYQAPVGYKQEYTFTAASPTAPTLTRKDIEMI